MATKATPTDAELILKLYDLRRESEIRKARDWWLVKFWPESADDVMKIANALGTQENNWLRQAGGYWEMAASMVVHGAINQELFLEPASSGEMFFFFAKFRPFLKELREKLNSPTMMANIEKLVMSTDETRQRLQMIEQRIAARKAAMKETSAAKAS
jgi:hypothetical protein